MAKELWREFAACKGVDPELFFPQYGGREGDEPTGAKIVCAGCVVRTACLNYALDNNEAFGIWGGKNESERRRLRRQRRREQQSAS